MLTSPWFYVALFGGALVWLAVVVAAAALGAGR
jgi:hypothetical protein